jgi:hypothetical protein
MKLKLLFCALTLGVLLSANAQFRKIPAEVTDSFRTRFDKASQVTWSDNLTSFQASFKLGNENLRAYFDSKGEWLKTEKNYDFEALPADIQDGYKKSKYTDWAVKEVLYVEEKDKQPRYRVQVRKSDFQKRNLYFSATGQLLDDSITL